ncbi:TPA: hypothetical protein ACIBNT_002383 [Salmonella enterica subsp. enterica serovar Birkenhead]
MKNQKCAKSRAAAAPWQGWAPGVPFEMKMIVDSICILKFSQALTDNLPCLNYVYLSGFICSHVMAIVNIRGGTLKLFV